MRLLWLVSWLLWIGGCTASAPRPEEPRVSPPPATTPAAAPVPAPAGPLTARAVSLFRGKPPLKSHGFDVTLRNPASEPRWLVLPETFPYAGREDPAPGGAESELQLFKLSEAPAVIVVKGVGSNLWAVRLPGAGTVTLRGLKIDSWWDEVPETTLLRMIVARELRVDGRPIAEVVGRSLDSASGADVAAPAGAGDERALEFWHPPGDDRVRGLPLTIEEEARAELRVALQPTPPP